MKIANSPHSLARHSLLQATFKFIFLALVFFPFLEATEIMPWFPRYLEIQPRATYLFQNYQKIDTKHGWQRHSSQNNILALSVSGSYARWAAELETSAAATRHRNFSPSDITLTGRYQIYDDVIGDPVSVTAGLSLLQVLKLARNDISCFYHGGIECEAHLAIGKEIPWERFWQSRSWAVLGFGCADIGSPWIRANAAWESNCFDSHRWRFYLDSLWGLGHKDLKLKKHFRGYGPIAHQSIDLGFTYSYIFDVGASLDAGYSYRVYARNCPVQVNQFTLSFLYPFGL